MEESEKTYTLEVQVDYFLNGFSVKTIVLVGIYGFQQFKGTIIFMVFDFQGIYKLYAQPGFSPSPEIAF